MRLLIRNGWVLRRFLDAPCEFPTDEASCPFSGFFSDLLPSVVQVDLLIEGDRLSQVGRALEAQADRVIEASHLLVVPGLWDMHVHLREPGREDKETILSGTRAAAWGGFTTVACMPNTQPTIDSPEILAHVLRQAEAYGSARVLPIASITRGLAGEEPSDWEALLEGGARGFSDDGRTVMNAEIMRRLLMLSARRGFPVICHCEDPHLAAGGVIHAGKVAEKLGLPGSPSLAEETIVKRDIALAEATGGHVHIAHVSTQGAVEAIREGKARGVHVTAEATPHHLTLTEEAVLERGVDAKMNPPLRTQEDVDAVAEALRDGTIDAIATDHAPHAMFEKARGMREAPFGIVGSETCVPVILTRLVRTGQLPLERALEALTWAPAQIFGEAKPMLKPGARADLTLIDLNRRETVDPMRFQSKSRNTPFVGWELQGWPVMTIREGKVTAKR